MEDQSHAHGGDEKADNPAKSDRVGALALLLRLELLELLILPLDLRLLCR